MSMNFAREQSLLRQKLQAKASPDLAAARLATLGSGPVTFLGADDTAVAQAASDVAAAWPAMGRAQMTAFVRTLWNSKIHELRDVGVRLLAMRAALLEPADLPLLEGFLQDQALDAVHATLARDVVGAVVARNRKLWKDLKRFAASTTVALRRAAVRASAAPLADDPDGFPRLVDVLAPLLAEADPVLQAAIDATLGAAAATHGESVRAFAQQHGRSIVVQKPAPAPVASTPTPAAAAAPAPKSSAPAKAAEPTAVVPAATKAVAKKKPVAKPKADKPAAKPPAPKKAAARTAKKPGAKGRAR
ncbi:MAG: DNA alkylation repair protein [Planctomycetes bacterium]|nr:DNA alkylation repair protein [Planctomycetota bacterium]